MLENQEIRITDYILLYNNQVININIFNIYNNTDSIIDSIIDCKVSINPLTGGWKVFFPPQLFRFLRCYSAL